MLFSGLPKQKIRKSSKWNIISSSQRLNNASWRVLNERIPTRANLDSRGTDLHSVLCPICDDANENEAHIFTQCKVAVHCWLEIFRWWDLDSRRFSCILDMITLADHLNMEATYTPFFDVVVQTTIWTIWCFGNECVLPFKKKEEMSVHVFKSKWPRKELILKVFYAYLRSS